MKRIIVLVMHGMPPKDFPQAEKNEWARHHAESNRGQLEDSTRYQALDRKMRDWPRTKENDPFAHASQELARELEVKSSQKVIIGYNEFCSPSFKEALEAAGKESPDQVLVVTPMLTPGGSHVEKDIPKTIEEVQKAFPKIKYIYAWPFLVIDVAEFLDKQIQRIKE